MGVQVGIGLNVSDAAVHVLDQIEGTSRRTQTFITVGVFQSLCERATWGLAYDALFEQYYDDVALGQLRGFAGYGVTPSTEVGVWFTKSAMGADATVGSTAVRLDPISQANGYVTRTWPTRARTTFWLGVAAGHDNVVLVFPANSRSGRVLAYGATLDLPLSDRFGGVAKDLEEPASFEGAPFLESGSAWCGDVWDEGAGVEFYDAVVISGAGRRKEGVAVDGDMGRELEGVADGGDEVLAGLAAQVPDGLAESVFGGIGFEVGPEEGDEGAA